MIVSITEFRQNLSKYLDMAQKEDIYITRYGVTICVLSSSDVNKLNLVESLVGVLPVDASLEDAREERLLNN